MGAQFTLLPILTLLYIVKPKALHRFVGYLEETASQTYADLIRVVDTPGNIFATLLTQKNTHFFTPSFSSFDMQLIFWRETGTHLNREWSQLKAPAVAINYWRLEKDAMWSDVLRNLFADETSHRDVNHTLAGSRTDH